MNATYHDSLVDLTETEMVFYHYYFPFGSAKRVPLADIAAVEAKRPTLFNGRWRIWGTSRFSIWFPCDFHRPSRRTIFMARLRDSTRSIGFTVERPQELAADLQARGIEVRSDPGAIA